MKTNANSQRTHMQKRILLLSISCFSYRLGAVTECYTLAYINLLEVVFVFYTWQPC